MTIGQEEALPWKWGERRGKEGRRGEETKQGDEGCKGGRRKERVVVTVATGREGGMLQGEDEWRERDKKRRRRVAMTTGGEG